jgi:hypothetical protein
MSDAEITTNTASADLEAGEADELPIVARMVVEIRSDGSRTIARGAIEDRLNDEQVAVEARADSPLELSRALAKMLFSAPFTALLGRGPGEPAKPPIDALPEARGGVRGKVGAIGRRIGQRVEDSLRARLIGRDPDER